MEQTAKLCLIVLLCTVVLIGCGMKEQDQDAGNGQEEMSQSAHNSESAHDEASEYEGEPAPQENSVSDLLQYENREPNTTFIREGFRCESWIYFDDNSILAFQRNRTEAYLTLFDFTSGFQINEVELSSELGSPVLANAVTVRKLRYANASFGVLIETNQSPLQYDYLLFGSDMKLTRSIAVAFPEHAYQSGPQAVMDDGRILYEVEKPDSKPQKQQLYLANSDGSDERLLIDVKKEIGNGGIWWIQTRGDYFSFNVTGHGSSYDVCGSGVYHVPSGNYQFQEGAFREMLLDSGLLLISGDVFYRNLGRTAPRICTADGALTIYEALQDKMIYRSSENARYLYGLGTAPESGACLVQAYDRLSGLYYEERLNGELFEDLDTLFYSDSHQMTSNGQSIFYLTPDSVFLRIPIDWSKAVEMAS